MKHLGVFFLLFVNLFNTSTFQIDKILTSKNNQQNAAIRADSDEARRLLVVQPEFTADASCLSYENVFGHGFGVSFKLAKKGSWYRRQSTSVIDYFVPDELPIRYLLKNKRYDILSGDAENNLWFAKAETPALLALDKSLKFEIVERKAVDFEINGKISQRELIKIKATGETIAGGDQEKVIAFLYAAPELKNLVVKTELIFPKGGRTCTLRNVSFAVPRELFNDFANYRRRQANKL